MRQGLSLRLRLNLMIVAVMLMIVGLGFVFAVHNARRSVEEETLSTVNLAFQLIEAGFAETRTTGRPLSEWLMQLGRLEHTRHLRIRVTGSVPSPIDLTGEKSTSYTAAPAWFHWAIAPEPVVTEQRLPDGRGGEITIRIEANTDDEIAESWQETRGFLFLLLALACAVYFLVHFTVGRAFRSVGTILGGLEDIEKGEYGKRLPGFPLPEFARISAAFNHMACALEKSRAENHALIQQSLGLQEEERRYLARELHDELGQSLTAIKVMAATLRHGGAQDREAADYIMSLCDRLFGVFRAMMRRLRPSLLDELGLTASLEDLVENWRNSHPGLAVDFACEPGIDEHAGNTHIHVFRIVQEGLTNVVKHAEAQHVRIRLRLAETNTHGPSIILSIRDDGRGFDPRQPPRGFGLVGMRERVASLGGHFELNAEPGRGVAIEIRIPSGEPSP